MLRRNCTMVEIRSTYFMANLFFSLLQVSHSIFRTNHSPKPWLQPVPLSWRQLCLLLCPTALISAGATGFKMCWLDWQPVIGICLSLSIANFDVIAEDPPAWHIQPGFYYASIWCKYCYKYLFKSVIVHLISFSLFEYFHWKSVLLIFCLALHNHHPEIFT